MIANLKSLGIALLVAFIVASTYAEFLRLRPIGASLLLAVIAASILAWLLLRDRRNQRIVQRQISLWFRANPRLATGISICALALVVLLLLVAAAHS